jgi:hypothetical protein
MSLERGLVVVLTAALAVTLLTGAAAPDGGGGATASYGPEEANYTVVPLSDRSPGAENVKYGQRVVATAGTDLATLEETTATYEAGSWSSRGPSGGETFGVDRGSTLEGYEVDETLQNDVKTFSAGEDDFGASTYLDDGDEFVSVAECIDNPDEPGWYRISGTTTGVTESGERVTFDSESHYFWICDCENEAEAHERLGPPPSEPPTTGTRGRRTPPRRRQPPPRRRPKPGRCRPAEPRPPPKRGTSASSRRRPLATVPASDPCPRSWPCSPRASWSAGADRRPLFVAGHRHRLVGLFEVLEVALRERDVERLDGVLEVFDLRGADDGRGDPLLVQQPRQR